MNQAKAKRSPRGGPPVSVQLYTDPADAVVAVTTVRYRSPHLRAKAYKRSVRADGAKLVVWMVVVRRRLEAL